MDVRQLANHMITALVIFRDIWRVSQCSKSSR